MELIRITPENLGSEHICCAISGNKKDIQVVSKKEWIAKCLDDGLVFLKGDVRGKCFIEYIPAENAWVPIEADGYMFINCFWVSGQFKGQGNANILLEECIRDSKQKGRKGICVISSAKKMPFLSDGKYLKYKGFKVADSAEPNFELMYLPFEDGERTAADESVEGSERTVADKPAFAKCVKQSGSEREKIVGDGFVVYYTHQCPFTAKYVPILAEKAKEMGVKFECILLDSKQKARKCPAPVTTFALFYNGKYITNEILSAAKFEKMARELEEAN